MIARYTRPEMGQLWEPQQRFENMLEVEVAVAQVQAELGIIPKSAALNIKRKAKVNLARIDEIEKTTKHDVIAFVSAVAEKVGPDGRYIHFGMTSSDVLDTALSLQIKKASLVLMKSMDRLDKALAEIAKKNADTLCAGRTHGMHAEPTTFGLKMAGYLAELRRNQERLEKALAQVLVGKLSGAVGTYSAQDPEVESRVCKKLGLQPETVATQVIPRDRHAEVMWALAMIGAGLERLAIELRHLQRTEVSEVVEGFTRGQKGSSAMPHKKNPISAENLTGAARLLRSYMSAAVENIALWHERDISHSSVERVIFPDAFILCDYAVDRMAGLIENLKVDAKRMRHNVNMSAGQLFSSHVLLALVDKGLSREDAYALVQRLSHSLGTDDHLLRALKKDPQSKKLLSSKELDNIFSGKAHLKHVNTILRRLKSSRAAKSSKKKK